MQTQLEQCVCFLLLPNELLNDLVISYITELHLCIAICSYIPILMYSVSSLTQYGEISISTVINHNITCKTW